MAAAAAKDQDCLMPDTTSSVVLKRGQRNKVKLLAEH